MTQTKTHSLLGRAWQSVMLAGSRELDELRSRSGPCCPNCGGHLLLRKVGFGHETGKKFWDCSNVPKCFVSLPADEVVWPEISVRAT
jgi:hypothetical protein